MTPKTKISSLFTQTDRNTVIDNLKNNPLLSVRFRTLTGELKERMIDFLCGTATLPLTFILGILRLTPGFIWICYRISI